MLDRWKQQFSGHEPITHSLRAAFPDRWVRFHSLPESKRYPDDETEFTTLLLRHNRILGELVDQDNKVVLLTTATSRTPDVTRRDPTVDSHDPQAKLWRVLAMHVLERDDWDVPTYWHVFASEWDWKAGQFDPLIRKVAMWEIVNVMIVAPDCRWLFAPYDGGMDVILESSEERDRLKAGHNDWLSWQPSGL